MHHLVVPECGVRSGAKREDFPQEDAKGPHIRLVVEEAAHQRLGAHPTDRQPADVYLDNFLRRQWTW